MCLEIKNYKGGGKAKYTKIAKRNITVYKVVRKLSYRYGFFSPFKYEPYKKGELKKVSSFTGSFGIINRGIHSYTTLERANQTLWESDNVVIKCVIPKGTKYVSGRRREVVSLALKVGEAVAGYEKNVFNRS